MELEHETKDYIGSTIVLPGKEMCSCMHMYNLGPRDVLSPPLHLSLIPLLRPAVREGERIEEGAREEGRKFVLQGRRGNILCSYNLYPSDVFLPPPHLNDTV